MKAEEFDRKFADGEDITGELDLANARRPLREIGPRMLARIAKQTGLEPEDLR